MFRRFRRKMDFAELPASYRHVDRVSEDVSLFSIAIRVRSIRRIKNAHRARGLVENNKGSRWPI